MLPISQENVGESEGDTVGDTVGWLVVGLKISNSKKQKNTQYDSEKFLSWTWKNSCILVWTMQYKRKIRIHIRIVFSYASHYVFFIFLSEEVFFAFFRLP